MDSQCVGGDPCKLAMPKRFPITRRGFGTKGKDIMLLTNHFKVSVNRTDEFFFHYYVNMKYEDDQPVDQKGVGRKVISKLQETYASELANKEVAYDGEKSLFTIWALPQTNNLFKIVLEDFSSGKTGTSRSPGGNGSPGASDKKRMKRSLQAKTFKVEINFATKVPMSAIAQFLRGQESENSQEALRVLDIILRGCLLVRQSFFHNKPSNFIDLGGGVKGCRGFHTSFRPTQSGLSLDIDISTTMIVRPGPVIDFLLYNQHVDNPGRIDWGKCALKNLRIKTTHTNSEFRIIGLSENTCYDQTRFHLIKEMAMTQPKRPTYVPLELCHLVPLQRYTKSLLTLQRSSLVEKSRQKPGDRMSTLSEALRNSDYDSELMLRDCGISIAREFTQVNGRVLEAPKLKAADGEYLFARNGRWNFNKKRLIQTSKVKSWGAVNFSTRCNVGDFVRRLIHSGNNKGIHMDQEDAVIEERPEMIGEPPARRVDDMFDQIMSKFPEGPPSFLLCFLPERKNCDIYGPWKCKCLAEFDIFTQCLAPTKPKIDDQYLTNLLLKINAKLGGLNSLLHIERTTAIPLVSSVPTIIFGMDVSHGSPGRSDIPSVAAVVSSLEWPLISKYRASVCTQSPKLEMIDSLFKLHQGSDHGIISELLIDFYNKSRGQKPEQIIIFRDGVSDSQFNQVLNIKLAQIIEACKFLDDEWFPKFTVIVAQKNHHTKFFLPKSDNNVPPGTIVDKGICHPRNYDFYMCAHAGTIGTTRPTHYHVLHDEIGFSPDDLQELVHSLSYVYQRSTTAISVVAPICYAHLAAAQVAQFIRLEDMSETSSIHGAHTSSSAGAAFPELPRLHKNVRSSMFFC